MSVLGRTSIKKARCLIRVLLAGEIAKDNKQPAGTIVFRDETHLQRIVDEAKAIVAEAIKAA